MKTRRAVVLQSPCGTTTYGPGRKTDETVRPPLGSAYGQRGIRRVRIGPWPVAWKVGLTLPEGEVVGRGLRRTCERPLHQMTSPLSRTTPPLVGRGAWPVSGPFGPQRCARDRGGLRRCDVSSRVDDRWRVIRSHIASRDGGCLWPDECQRARSGQSKRRWARRTSDADQGLEAGIAVRSSVFSSRVQGSPYCREHEQIPQDRGGVARHLAHTCTTPSTREPCQGSSSRWRCG